MRKNYDFERYNPPRLNEKMLQEKAESRKLRRNILCIVVLAVIIQIGTVVLGLMLMKTSPTLALRYFFQAFLGSFAGVMAAVIYVTKRRRGKT